MKCLSNFQKLQTNEEMENTITQNINELITSEEMSTNNTVKNKVFIYK